MLDCCIKPFYFDNIYLSHITIKQINGIVHEMLCNIFTISYVKFEIVFKSVAINT